MKKETRPIVLLWGLSRGSGFLYIISLCAMLASVFCNFLLPWTIRFVVDSVIGARRALGFRLFGFRLDAAFAENDFLIGVFVIGVAIIGGVFSLISQKTLSMAAEGFIKRLRDEAHRFAITYHRELRGKGMTRSVLDTIPGLGAKRKKLLMKHFVSMKRLRAASVEEIASLKGIPQEVAKEVFAVLQQ
jgi:ABC-type multidrug transport system fused ATPase/permease subunit